MSHLFDFSKKSLAHTGNSTPVFSETDSIVVERTLDLQKVPVNEVEVKPESRIVLHTDPRSAGADRFRFLRMRLQVLWNGGKLRSLLITSPLPQDGKSTVALNLATALAEKGKRTVLLIEADLHHPSVAVRLGLAAQPGLAECLEGKLDPMVALRRVEPLGWYLLHSGKTEGNPTELLQPDGLSRLMRTFSPQFDWIIIDAPPVTPLTDALSLSHHVNASLLVAREGRTPREGLKRAVALLGKEKTLGIILNGIEGMDQLYSGYYGYGGANK